MLSTYEFVILWPCWVDYLNGGVERLDDMRVVIADGGCYLHAIIDTHGYAAGVTLWPNSRALCLKLDPLALSLLDGAGEQRLLHQFVKFFPIHNFMCLVYLEIVIVVVVPIGIAIAAQPIARLAVVVRINHYATISRHNIHFRTCI